MANREITLQFKLEAAKAISTADAFNKHVKTASVSMDTFKDAWKDTNSGMSKTAKEFNAHNNSLRILRKEFGLWTSAQKEAQREQTKEIKNLERINKLWSEGGVTASKLAQAEKDLSIIITKTGVNTKKTADILDRYGRALKIVNQNTDELSKTEEKARLIQMRKGESISKEINSLDKLHAKYSEKAAIQLKLGQMEREILLVAKNKNLSQKESNALIEKHTKIILASTSAAKEEAAAVKSSLKSKEREKTALHDVRMEYDKQYSVMIKMAAVRAKLKIAVDAGVMSMEQSKQREKEERVAIDGTTAAIERNVAKRKAQLVIISEYKSKREAIIASNKAEATALDALYSKYSKDYSIKMQLKALEADLITLKTKKNIKDKEIIAIRERETAAIRGVVAEQSRELAILSQLRAERNNEKAQLISIHAKYDESVAKKQKLKSAELELKAILDAGLIKKKEMDRLYAKEVANINKVVTAKHRETKARETNNRATARQIEFLFHNMTNIKATYRAVSDLAGHYTKLTATVVIAATAVAGLAGSFKNMTMVYSDFLSARNALAVSTINLEDIGAGFNMKEANKQMRWAIDLSIRHALSTKALIADYSKFSAAAKLSGATMKDINSTFENFSRAARIMGMDSRKTTNMFLALQQMFSKGKVSAEELRRQLGEYLPGAFQVAAHSMGITGDSLGEITRKFDKMVSTGKVLTLDFMPKFSKLIGELFGEGLLAEALQKPVAALERFTGAWEIFMANVGSKIAPLFVAITNSMTKAIYLMNSAFSEKGGMGVAFVEEMSTSKTLAMETMALMQEIDKPGSSKKGGYAEKVKKINDNLKELKNQHAGLSDSTNQLNDKNKELNSTLNNQTSFLASTAMSVLGISDANAMAAESAKNLDAMFEKVGGSADFLTATLMTIGGAIGTAAIFSIGRWILVSSGISKVISFTAILLRKIYDLTGGFKKLYSIMVKIIPKLAMVGAGIKALAVAVGLSVGGLGLMAAGIVSAGVAIGLYISRTEDSTTAIIKSKDEIDLYIEKLKELKSTYDDISSPIDIFNNKIASIKAYKLAEQKVVDLKEALKELEIKLTDANGKFDKYSSIQYQVAYGMLTNAKAALKFLAIEVEATGDAFENSSAKSLNAFRKFASSLKTESVNKRQKAYETDLKKLNDYYKVLQEQNLDSIKINKLYSESLVNLNLKHKSYLDSLNKNKKGINDLTNAQEKYLKMLKAEVGEDQLEKQRKVLESLNGVGTRLAKTKKELIKYAKLEKEAYKEQQKEIKQSIKATETYNKLLDDLEKKYSPLAAAQEKMNMSIGELDVLMVAGRISAEDYAKSMYEIERAYMKIAAQQGAMSEEDQFFLGLNDGLWDFANNSKTVFEEMSELTSRSFNSMTDELTEFVTTGKMDFKGLVDSIVKDLTRIAIQKSITEPLADALFSSSGLLGSLFGGVTSSSMISGQTGFTGGVSGVLSGAEFTGFADGGVFSRNGVVPFADGGVIDQPTFMPLVGEDGPEAVMPLKRGADGKLGLEGGSTTTVSITINVQGTNGNPEAIRRSAGQVAQAAGNATQRAMRRNG